MDIIEKASSAPVVVDRHALLLAHHALARLAEEISEIDVTKFETACVEELHAKLIPMCVDLLNRFKEILRELAPSVLLPGAAEVDCSPDSHGRRTLDVDQVCYVAKLELCQLEELLERQVGGPQEQLLLACGRTLRRARKAVDAVQESLRRLLRLPEVGRTDQNLAVSLVVREEYARFRRLADFAMPTSLSATAEMIHGQGARLAVLMERPGYRLARLKDRLVLCGL